MDFSAAVMAGGLMSAGWSLEVGPGMWLGAEARIGWISVGAELRGLFPATAVRYASSRRDSDLNSISGLLVPCVRWKILLGCVVLEAGELTFTKPTSSSNFSDVLVGTGLRAGVAIPLFLGFSARGFAELSIRPHNPAVAVSDQTAGADSMWRLAVVNGFFGVGLAWSP